MNKTLLRNTAVLFASLTLFALLAACSSKVVPQPVKEGYLTPVTEIDPAGLFSANPDGLQVALVRDGLLLLDLQTQQRIVLSDEVPVALDWNREGTQLAAVYPAGENRTRLRIFEPQGDLLMEATLPVTFLQFKWPARGDLLLAGYALKNYSFGSNLSQTLYLVSTTGPVPLPLSDTTIKPSTARALTERMADYLPVSFSVQGDELVYVRLHDPPEFPPYLQMVYRNWQVPQEILLERLGLKPVRLHLDQNQERVELFSPTGALSDTIDLWGVPRKAEVEASLVGQQSPSGRYQLFDGLLYDGPQLIAQWSPESRLQFLKKGRFLLAVSGQLYLGGGLEPEPWPEYHEKTRVLRRWLHHGLITYDEYLAQLRELQP